MLQRLKEEVCEANLRLVREGLVILTWGNASGIDRREGVMVIKPSGIPYAEMRPKHMVAVSLKTGETLEGDLKPSSDAPTHLELYRSFKMIGGIVHSHSPHATAWAQARRELPVLGTTHADHFLGAIPCTREMKKREIESEYERNTGRVIVERLKRMDPTHMPAVLVGGHGPFTWGETIGQAVENAIALEQVARMATETFLLNPSVLPLEKALREKHFFRKHGSEAYYGQKRKPGSS